jgi:hypothetical protein
MYWNKFYEYMVAYYNQLTTADIVAIIVSIALTGFGALAGFALIVLAFLYLEEKKSPWK